MIAPAASLGLAAMARTWRGWWEKDPSRSTSGRRPRARTRRQRAQKILFVAPRPGQKALLDTEESGYHGNQFDEGGEILSVYFEAALVVDLKNKSEGWSRSGRRLRSLA
eukprot:TRINITY_DN17480_c0_g1_i1.p3 TRINITY_DN17480_c0_g1~~TRINITY_DN17480_c0_g1_i1.p3  ORF type:complete len:109 (+),score=24.86 TRINITY_DN17480_c0_g1_i1:366-692(+)